MEKYIIGMVGITALMAGWVFIQSFWRKTFSDELKDDDVLAGRSSCGNCGCTTSCLVKQKNKLSKI